MALTNAIDWRGRSLTKFSLEIERDELLSILASYTVVYACLALGRSLSAKFPFLFLVSNIITPMFVFP